MEMRNTMSSILKTILIVTVLFIGSSTTFSQVNDFCSGAIDITPLLGNSLGVDCTTISPLDPPVASLPGIFTNSSPNLSNSCSAEGVDAWFFWVANSTSLYWQYQNAGANPGIHIYSGTCNNLTEVDCLSTSSNGSLNGWNIGDTLFIQIHVVSIATNQTMNFCIQATNPIGCTDPNACNYDPIAVIDDGSCLLNYGCTNPNYCEYNPCALTDDGSCMTLITTQVSCNLDCTLGNIEFWNAQTCQCEDSIVFNAPFPAQLDLANISINDGFLIIGEGQSDNAGESLSHAGDVNGDGFDDLIIGTNALEDLSYVVYGSNTIPSSLNLTNLNGTNGFKIRGFGNDTEFVSSAGDINGDGLGDVLISYRYADPNGNSAAGICYVIFGSSTSTSPSFILSNLNGSNGFEINGIDPGDWSGVSISCAGDVNADGIDDLIIGASLADPNGNNSAGESYVVFGSTIQFPSTLNLSTLNGSNGFVINGIDPNDNSGHSVSTAGDINADGITDILIGARNADPNGNSSAGESYIVFGSNNQFPASINLSSLNGTNGFTINGIDAIDFSGNSVSPAGDFNADGIDDVIIGAFRAGPNGTTWAGESYILFGSNLPFPASINLSTLNGSNGFVINGIDSGDESGISVSNAGDINGDGIDDIIIGAFEADPNGNSSAGESYVVFGSSIPFPSFFNLTNLNGTNGFVINGIDGGDASGTVVSNAGDINGDGIGDILIGAPNGDTNFSFNVGESYVIFGKQYKIQGCTDSLANNYNPNANCDDGSCVYPCIIQTCNQDCTLGDIETFNLATCQCEVALVTVSGCTDLTACNYNPNANCGDGSCLYVFGCTDPNFCEYDPNAACDDGSCITLNNANLQIFLSASIPPNNPSNDNGYIQLLVLGGSGNYTYTWSPNISSNNFAANLGFGTYNIYVEDTVLCGNAITTLTFLNPNCPSTLNFSTTNPSMNAVEQADDIITTSENLNANRIYKAGHYQIIEYIELQAGFQSGIYNFEALNEQCDLND